MPTTKRTSVRRPPPAARKARKRPVTRARKTRTGPLLTSYVSNDPFPPRKNFKLVYSQTYTYPVGSSGTFGSENIFRLNSLHDPDETGVGHQPYGYDQLKLLYRRYKVNGVLLEMTWTDPNQDGLSVAAMLTPPLATSTLAGLGFDQASEKPFTTTRMINNSGSQRIYMKQYIPISTAVGITPSQFRNDLDDYQALTGASPNRVPRVRLAVCSPSAATGGLVQCTMKMTFYSSFWDRIVLGQS